MVKSATVREIFDEMSLNVTAFLEVLVLFHWHVLRMAPFSRKLSRRPPSSTFVPNEYVLEPNDFTISIIMHRGIRECRS
jgi:hypothetical protein